MAYVSINCKLTKYFPNLVWNSTNFGQEMAQGNGNMMRYAGLATQMMVMMLIAVWAGYKLDKYLGWKIPVLLILFPVTALVISLWGIIREFNKSK